jgi:hypothetical protein
VLTLMQTGKARIIPVVLLDRPEGGYWESWMNFLNEDLFTPGFISPDDFHFFKIVHSVPAAVEEIIGFYRIYHSARWVGQRLVLRIQQPLSEARVAQLNDKFADVLRSGAIVQTDALPPEKNEPELAHLPRLVLSPHRHSFGRFRQLIDAINRSE